MWSQHPVTTAWTDCLDAIQEELESLRRIRGNMSSLDSFQEELCSHEIRVKFDNIWRYAGTAVKHLRRP